MEWLYGGCTSSSAAGPEPMSTIRPARVESVSGRRMPIIGDGDVFDLPRPLRERDERHVAEVVDLVDATVADIGKDGFECQGVAVDVGDEGQAGHVVSALRRLNLIGEAEV